MFNNATLKQSTFIVMMLVAEHFGSYRIAVAELSHTL